MSGAEAIRSKRRRAERATAALQSINIARAASRHGRVPQAAGDRSQRQTSPESTMLVNCVAYQNGKKLADIPVAGHQRVRDAGPIASSGSRWFDPDARGARTRWPRSSTSIRSPSRMRARVISGRRSRNTTTRCSSCCIRSKRHPRPAGSRLIVGEVDIFVGPNYILSVRAPDAEGLSPSVRAALRARAGAAARFGSGFVLVRADGYRRRSLLPDPRNVRVGARADRGAHLRRTIPRDRTSRRSMR